jgi:hypothetical protein
MDKTVITLILVVLAAFGLYLSVPDAQLSPFERMEKDILSSWLDSI